MLCKDCFSVGVESNFEWTTKNVRPADAITANQLLLMEEWTADEEVRLIEGLLKYGFGNWQSISAHLSGTKYDRLCEKHYIRFYLRQDTYPLPDFLLPPIALGSCRVDERSRHREPTFQQAEVASKEASSAGTNTSKLYTEAGQRAGQRAKERRGASGMVMQAGQIEAADMVGYMPLRAEYDSEWENEAEFMIVDVEFASADTAARGDFKLEQLHAYNRALHERQLRRDFVQQHNLIEHAVRLHALDRRITRDERSLRVALRPYAGYIEREAHESLTNCLMSEASLRRRVGQLIVCSLAGIKASCAVEAFDKLSTTEGEGAYRALSGGRDREQERERAERGGAMWSLGVGTAVFGSNADGTCGARPFVSTVRARVTQALALTGRTHSHETWGRAISIFGAGETALCTLLGIGTTQYSVAKRLLLSEALMCGGSVPLDRGLTAMRPQLDAVRGQHVWLLCAQSGWITP